MDTTKTTPTSSTDISKSQNFGSGSPFALEKAFSEMQNKDQYRSDLIQSKNELVKKMTDPNYIASYASKTGLDESGGILQSSAENQGALRDMVHTGNLAAIGAIDSAISGESDNMHSAMNFLVNQNQTYQSNKENMIKTLVDEYTKNPSAFNTFYGSTSTKSYLKDTYGIDFDSINNSMVNGQLQGITGTYDAPRVDVTNPTLVDNALSSLKTLETGSADGDYTKVGDNGTSFGAYQFQDKTWQAVFKEHPELASQYGDYVNSANGAPKDVQDAVARAYATDILKDHSVKDLGLIWNGGSTTPHISADGGKSYNSEAYSSNLVNAFNKVSGITAPLGNTVKIGNQDITANSQAISNFIAYRQGKLTTTALKQAEMDPDFQKLTQEIYKQNPTWTPAVAANFNTDLNRNSPSSVGGAVNTGNTIIGHMNEWYNGIKTLNNGNNLKTYNSLTNSFNLETQKLFASAPKVLGDDGKENVDTQYVYNEAADWLKKNGGGNESVNSVLLSQVALAGELSKFYKGGSPSESEIGDWMNRLSVALSPDVAKSTLKTAVKLMSSRLNGIAKSYERANLVKPKPEDLLTGDAIGVLQSLGMYKDALGSEWDMDNSQYKDDSPTQDNSGSPDSPTDAPDFNNMMEYTKNL